MGPCSPCQLLPLQGHPSAVPTTLFSCDGARGVSQRFGKRGKDSFALLLSPVPPSCSTPQGAHHHLITWHTDFHPSLPQEQSRAELAMGRLKDNSQSLPAGRVQLRNLSQEGRRLQRGGPGAETLPTLPNEAWQRHRLPHLPFQVPFP